MPGSIVRPRRGAGPGGGCAALFADGGVLELCPAARRPEPGYLRRGVTAPTHDTEGRAPARTR
ncbi:hypothetical protein ACFQ7Z_17460 [Streptomyces virginiae]|uniref:hypothetical protein n=1 Tax=Streptomyces virginiae TaxID=1961 RepID=UPI0036A28B52